MKKTLLYVITVILMTAMLATSLIMTTSADNILYGDCNGDGVVNGKDLIRLRKYLIGSDVALGPSECAEHSFGEWETAVEPTCTKAGVLKRTCIKCFDIDLDSTPALGHDYLSQFIAPTCVEQGYTLHTCTRCGDSYKDNYTAIIDHTYGEWTVTAEPTCTEPGVKRHVCSVCGKTEEESVPALGHEYGDDGVCIRCGEEDPHIATDDKYFVFTLLDNGTYSISAADKNDLPARIVLPTKHEGIAVTEVAADAFSESIIKSVVIGEGVITVNGWAFWKCSDLKSVTLPRSLHTIGTEAFKGCDSLTSAIFEDPDGWDKFNSATLSNVNAAAEKIRTEFSIWYHHTWGDSTTITELTCSQNGYYRHNCSVCEQSEYYYIYAAGHDFDDDDICKKCGERYTPTDDSYFEFSRLDDGTYSIKAKAGVSLPSYVILPQTHNGKSVTKIEDSAFERLIDTQLITISRGVTSIGDYAFFSCSGLTSITMPNGVTSIGDSAFYNCSSLTSITIPDGVTSIGEGAFAGCTGLTSITIPDGVTSIGSDTFYGGNGLTSINIPDGVTSIGDYAFYGCSGLTDIYYNGTKAQWNEIIKYYKWNYNTGDYTVHCTDGDIPKN